MSHEACVPANDRSCTCVCARVVSACGVLNGAGRHRIVPRAPEFVLSCVLTCTFDESDPKSIDILLDLYEYVVSCRYRTNTVGYLVLRTVVPGTVGYLVL